MARGRQLTRSLGHQESIRRYRQPQVPEWRPDPKPPAPCPLQTDDDWRAAWAEAVANDPETRAMLGLT